jgi:gamma-tubulin complex component 5
MTTRLGNAEDIDAMAEIHAKYISRLQAQCLLSKNLSPINQAIISLLDLGVLFTDVLLQNCRKNTDSFTAQPQPNLSRDKRKTRRKPAQNRRRSVMPAPESSSDGDEEDDYDADAESTTSHEATFAESLAKIQEQFDRLVPFITAGLRSVSRAGGEVCWEMLAEKLDWQTSRSRS